MDKYLLDDFQWDHGLFLSLLLFCEFYIIFFKTLPSFLPSVLPFIHVNIPGNYRLGEFESKISYLVSLGSKKQAELRMRRENAAEVNNFLRSPQYHNFKFYYSFSKFIFSLFNFLKLRIKFITIFMVLN